MDIEDRIGYSFKDRGLLFKALTHASLQAGGERVTNERLEFIGDAVCVQRILHGFMQGVEQEIVVGAAPEVNTHAICRSELFHLLRKIEREPFCIDRIDVTGVLIPEVLHHSRIDISLRGIRIG